MSTTMTNSWPVRFGILITMVLALCVVADRASAQGHPTNAVAGPIHVRDFAMWDQFTPNLGFDIELTSGLPDCVANWIPVAPGIEYICSSNGYFHMDFNEYIPDSAPEDFTWLTAVYHFFDEEGDRLTITAQLAPTAPSGYQTDTLYIMSLEFDGPDVHFENGISIDGWRVDFSLADGQVFGIANLYASEFNDGFWMGDFGGSTMEIDPFLSLNYSQTTEGETIRPMKAVPVPEPGFAAALASGVAILGFFGRKKREH